MLEAVRGWVYELKIYFPASWIFPPGIVHEKDGWFEGTWRFFSSQVKILFLKEHFWETLTCGGVEKTSLGSRIIFFLSKDWIFLSPSTLPDPKPKVRQQWLVVSEFNSNERLQRKSPHLTRCCRLKPHSRRWTIRLGRKTLTNLNERKLLLGRRQR
jgi:hypothetical protein